MLRAALTSRSWRRPAAARPLPHVQRQSRRGRLRTPNTPSTRGTSGRRPPGRGRTTGTCTPPWSAAPATPASEMARASEWLASMLRTCRSSITTAWFSRTSRVVSLCRWSRRRSVIRACTRATCRRAFSRFADPRCVRASARCARASRTRSRPLVARVGDLLPAGQGDQDVTPASIPTTASRGRAVLDGDLAQQRHVPAPRRCRGTPSPCWARPPPAAGATSGSSSGSTIFANVSAPSR